MGAEIWDPQEIERRSMEIIDARLGGMQLKEVDRPIYQRVAHAYGDVEMAKLLVMSENAVETALRTIREGCAIVTDVAMVQAGINSRTLESFGCRLTCYLSAPEVPPYARNRGITRSAAAMELYGGCLNGNIAVVGNAPTALFKLIELMDKGLAEPALVIGTPVGFVGAAESKEELINYCRIKKLPFITIRGTRGGSTGAAAILNAIIYQLQRIWI